MIAAQPTSTKDCTVPTSILQTDQANNAPHDEREDTGTSQLYICCL